MANGKKDLIEAGGIVMPGKTMSERSEKIKIECSRVSGLLRCVGRTVEGLGAIKFQPCNPWTRAITGLTNYQNIRGLHLAVILYELADMVTYRGEEEQT